MTASGARAKEWVHRPAPSALAAVGLASGLVLAGLTPAPFLLAPLVAARLAPRRSRAFLAGAAAGLLLGLGTRARAAAEVLPDLRLPAVHEVEGRVLDVAPPAAFGQRATVRLDRVGERPTPRPLDVAWFLPPRAGPALLPGDRVRGAPRLEARRLPRGPGAARWRRGPALLAVGARVEVVRHADGPLAWVAGLRAALARMFDRRLGGEDAGLARALLLGDRSALRPPERRRFRLTGQGHLLAVSGLHVGLLLAGLLGLVRLAGGGRRTVALAGLVLVVVYVPLAGAPPSAVRAGGAACLLFLGRLARRDATGAALLGGVALVVLALDPEGIDDPALVLSFAAVLGILWLSAPLTRLLLPQIPVVPGIVDPPRAPFRRSLAVAGAAWLGTVPVLLARGAVVAPFGAPLSVVTVMLAAVLLATGALTILLAPLPFLGAGAAAAFGKTAASLRFVLDRAIDGGLGGAPTAPPGAVWYAGYGIALLALARGTPREARRGLGLSIALVLLALAPPARPPPAFPRLLLLDVGAGHATLLLLPDGRRALVDTGAAGDPGAVRRVVVPALGALGIDRLDLLVVTGAGEVAGAADLLEAVPVGQAALPEGVPSTPLAAPAATVVRHATEGEVLLGGAWGALLVLAREDPARTGSAEAPALVVLLETAGGPRVILPASAAAEDVRLARVRRRAPPLAGGEVLDLSAGRSGPEEEGTVVVDVLPSGSVLSTPWAAQPPGYDPPAAMPPPPPLAALELAIGLALLLVFAVVAVRPLAWLTPRASSAAFGLGALTWVAFAGPGLVALFLPFAVATLLGRLPGGERAPARTARQVVANGLVAAAGAGLALAGASSAGVALALGAFSFLGADTAATEIGVRLGGTPRDVRTGRRVPPGTSGAVSVVGLAASVLGAALGPVAWVLLLGGGARTVALAAAAGTVGTFADSVLGATLQRRGRDVVTGHETEDRRTRHGPTERVRGLEVLDNDGVNLAGSLVSGLVAWALLAALG